jgi:hypothetical protein
MWGKVAVRTIGYIENCVAGAVRADKQFLGRAVRIEKARGLWAISSAS